MTTFRPADLDEDALAVLRARAMKAGQWYSDPSDVDNYLRQCTQILAGLKKAVDELAAELGPKHRYIGRYGLYNDLLLYRELCAQEAISSDKKHSVTTPSTLSDGIDAYISAMTNIAAVCYFLKKARPRGPSGIISSIPVAIWARPIR